MSDSYSLCRHHPRELTRPPSLALLVHADVVREVLERLARGRIKAAYKNKPLSLDRIRQAHRDVESEGFGRVVVKP